MFHTSNHRSNGMSKMLEQLDGIGETPSEKRGRRDPARRFSYGCSVVRPRQRRHCECKRSDA